MRRTHTHTPARSRKLKHTGERHINHSHIERKLSYFSDSDIVKYIEIYSNSVM